MVFVKLPALTKLMCREAIALTSVLRVASLSGLVQNLFLPTQGCVTRFQQQAHPGGGLWGLPSRDGSSGAGAATGSAGTSCGKGP